MNGSFSEWTERLKVYNDYINALANYRLNVAKAEKEHAEAANLWSRRWNASSGPGSARTG